ncbi:AMP-binding protein [Acidimangrovimonas sediminis]|uniref:AMP-binding protein n=1 Tax=Acidimangrovimonas sediminis TaxID=2056283 RepID=UPI001304FECF|nr:AMP-binding protein [Acidimangrovimonas sediminis]
MQKTTRPARLVQTIDDIRAIEALPYREQVSARNLYDLFRATARHCGSSPALTVLRGPDPRRIGVALSHEDLLEEVTRAGNLFHALGLARGAGVAAFLSPTLPEFPALLFGAQVAGVASTINYLLNRDAIVDLLTAQKATILVVPAPELDADCWQKTAGILKAVPSLRKILVIGAEGDLPEGYVALDRAMAGIRSRTLDFTPADDPDTVCALFHTGGTTGRPKLVQLTHGNQIHAAFGFGQVFGYDEADAVVNGFPFFHVGGTMTAGLSVLAAGAHMIVPSPYALRPPDVVRNLWQIAEALDATVISGVPTSIGALAGTWTPGRDLSRLRMVATGGAGLPAAVGARFEKITGLRIFETYGMTEAAAAIAFNPGHGTPVAGSVGFRAPFSETRILRIADGTTPCGPGESGLVQIRGPQVFPGYVEARHNEGVLDAEGWLTTGDVGYLTEDERLVLTGREKDLIVRSGHNIDPTAIEDVANRAPDVEISAAVGMPDQYAGEVPILFVVPRAGMTINLDALQRTLDEGIHERPARPRRILVIDALPVTSVGKIFKPALRERAIAEKLRLEVAEHCGPDATLDVVVSTDAQRRTVVDAIVSGAEPASLAALSEVLAPLPQTYRVDAACVGLEVAGGVALVTLDRPESLNSASRALMRSLEIRLREVAALPDLRAVIMTGSGRAFCAGGDLIEFDEARAADGSALIDTLAYNQRVISMIEDLPVPVIGAANGVAVAGGLEMLLCCDMVLAAEGARLGDGHAKYGIVPAGGATLRLAERIGRARAAQLFFTAGMIDARTACDWGLVNEVLPPDRLMPRAREIAAQIAACSPEVIGRIKRLTAPAAAAEPRALRLRAEIDEFTAHLGGADLAEGLTAFREKRTPRFAPREENHPVRPPKAEVE